MTERISVAVVNNKIDNLDKKVDELKSDFKDDMESMEKRILEAIKEDKKSNNEKFLPRADFAAFKYIGAAIGAISIATLSFVVQQALTRTLFK